MTKATGFFGDYTDGGSGEQSSSFYGTDKEYSEAAALSAAAAAASAAEAAGSEAGVEADATAAEAAKLAAQAAQAAAETAETNAESSETAASSSATSAAGSATTATTKASEASSSATAAASSASTATTQAGNASTSASNAADSATAASTSASSAATSATSAASSAGTATTQATAASGSATAAASSATAASSSATSAASSATDAETAQTAAEAAQTAAEAAEAGVEADATAAAASASAAATSESNAAASASAASTSETNAATSESNAATSATAASGSATAAASSASAASTSASNAATSASNASASETAASASETAAASSATSASTSASNASTSATNASNSASAASTSASNASTSESNAAASASNASTSESNASSSATAAAGSATAAAGSASAASASADAALSALDNFDDRYLGQKATAPTVDNDGDALVTGALYFDTTDDAMKVWDGSQWLAAYASLSGALIAVNNLSDLSDAAAARTNLGLGTAATTDSTAYATAAQGSTADSALQNVSEDTTPQLGGDLDTNGNDIAFGDNDKATFGASSDLQLYHTGSHSYLLDSGTGNLYIEGQQVVIKGNSSGQWNAIFADGGDSIFYHSNVGEVARTKSTGVDVTGTVTADGLSLGDNDAATFGASNDLQIFHNGSHSYLQDNGTGNLFIEGQQTVISGKSSGNWNAQFVDNGDSIFYHSTNGEKARVNSTGVDVTGTVTADGLTVDSTLATIGSGGSTNQATELRLNGTSNAGNGAYLRGRRDGSNAFLIGDTAGALGSGTGVINYVYGSNPWSVYTNTDERLTVEGNGDISFYEDTGTTAKFFWDASAESLGIGTSSPSAPLEISGLKNTSTIRLTSTTNDSSWSNEDYFGRLEFWSDDASGVGAGAKGSIVSASIGGSGSTTYMAFNVASTTENDIERMRIDNAGNVGIGTSSPQSKAHVSGFASTVSPVALGTNGNAFSYTAGANAFGLTGGVLNSGAVYVQSGTTSGTGIAYSLALNPNGGNVGIGTTSPNALLDVTSNSSPTVRISNTRSDSNWDVDPVFGALEFYSSDASGSGASVRASVKAEAYSAFGNATDLVFRNGDALGVEQENLRIDYLGNVGIGTSSPSTGLHIKDDDATLLLQDTITGFSTQAAGITLTSTDGSGNPRTDVQRKVKLNGDALTFTRGTADTEHMRIDSSGNVGIGTSSPSQKLTVANGYGIFEGIKVGQNGTDIDSTFLGASSLLAFKLNGTERARIDNSGNVLVGKTSSGSNTEGVELLPQGAIYAVRSSNVTGVFNRKSTDGDIVHFRKDGTTVGSIGVKSADLCIGNDDTGIRFGDGGNSVIPHNMATNVTSDGVVSFGTATERFKDLHLSGDVNFGGVLSVDGSTGTSGQVLTSNGSSSPSWQTISAGLAQTASVGASGWWKCNDTGLIIQWGVTGSISANGNTTVTLPLTMPTLIRTIYATRNESSITSSDEGSLNCISLGTSQIRIYNSAGGTTNAAFWMVIGN